MRVRHVAPIAALLLGATPALAQQAPPRPAGYKDPGTATIVGLFVPGAGQLWIHGEARRKGWLLFGVGYGSLFVVPAIALATDTVEPLYFAPIGFLGATIYGAVTAAGDADAHNRRLAGRTALLERVQPVVAPGRGGTAVGLSLRF